MLNLPQSTEMSRPLPKKSIYDKFGMSAADKAKFDTDIRRLAITNEISPTTMNIAAGETVGVIFVILITLRNEVFDKKNIALLSKLIPQKMLFVLEYEGNASLAIFHSKLLQSAWQPLAEMQINLSGLNLEAAWESIVAQVGGVVVEDGKSLDEQLAVDEEKARLQKQIAALEKKVQREKQFNKQMALNAELKMLRMRLEGTK